MERGNTIHLKAEHFLKGDIRGVPPELEKLKKEFLALKKMKPEHIEEFWGFDRDWRPLRKGFEPRQTFTLKADVATAPKKGVAINIDHKSGRIYPAHDDQAELTALASWLWYPAAKKIEVEFWYVDLGDIVAYEFTNTYLAKRKKFWSNEGRKIMSETKFLPTPSQDACKWCAFKSSKGGPCDAWKKLRS